MLVMGLPIDLLDFDEMIIRSPCWKAWEKYNGDGHALTHPQTPWWTQLQVQKVKTTEG
jgi:hypothetical protein